MKGSWEEHCHRFTLRIPNEIWDDLIEEVDPGQMNQHLMSLIQFGRSDTKKLDVTKQKIEQLERQLEAAVEEKIALETQATIKREITMPQDVNTWSIQQVRFVFQKVQDSKYEDAARGKAIEKYPNLYRLGEFEGKKLIYLAWLSLPEVQKEIDTPLSSINFSKNSEIERK